jgi:hypothetical protein
MMRSLDEQRLSDIKAELRQIDDLLRIINPIPSSRGHRDGYSMTAHKARNIARLTQRRQKLLKELDTITNSAKGSLGL